MLTFFLSIRLFFNNLLISLLHNYIFFIWLNLMFQELLKENLKPGMRALDVGSGNQKSISFHFFEFGLLGLSFFLVLDVQSM